MDWSRNSPLRKALRWFIALAALAYVAWFLLANREGVGSLPTLRPDMLAAAVLLQALSMVVSSCRYHIVLQKCSEKPVPFLAWTRLFLLGQFANMMVPQAGNVLRGVRLKQDWGVSYTRYVSSYISFQWIDTALTLVLAAGVILATRPGFRIGSFNAVGLLGVIFAAVVLGPFLARGGLRRWSVRPGWAAWAHGRASQAIDLAVASAHDPVYMAKMVATGVLGFVMLAATVYSGFACLDIYPTLSATALFCVLLRIGLILQITPGNIGVRELVWGVLGELTQIGKGPSLWAALLFRIISSLIIFGSGIACGGFDLLRSGRARPAAGEDENVDE